MSDVFVLYKESEEEVRGVRTSMRGKGEVRSGQVRSGEVAGYYEAPLTTPLIKTTPGEQFTCRPSN